MKSKHLIKYEKKYFPAGKKYMAYIKDNNPDYYEKHYGDSKVKCRSEWDYEFDSRGNLVRIDFIQHDWFDNHCVIHIKYVDE